MPINYVVRKKKDQSGNEVKELYYAVPSAIQNKGVSEKQLAEDLHDNSSLSAGDVLSVLEQLPKAIARHMKEGRTVTIRGLGTFYPALSSEGCETPEECTPNKVRLTRICFRADTAKVCNCDLQRGRSPVRKSEPKDRTFSGLGLNPDLAPQLLNNHFTDRQSQSGALYKSVVFDKALKNMFALLGGHTTTGIGYIGV